MPAKGQDYQFLLLDGDGEIVKTISPNDMTFNLVETRERIERTGTRLSPIDQTISGWEGKATFDEEDFALDDLIQGIQDGYFSGQKIADMEILHTKYIPELGATRTYRYPGVKLGYNENAGGQKDKISKEIDWESGPREILA